MGLVRPRFDCIFHFAKIAGGKIKSKRFGTLETRADAFCKAHFSNITFGLDRFLMNLLVSYFVSFYVWLAVKFDQHSKLELRLLVPGYTLKQ